MDDCGMCYASRDSPEDRTMAEGRLGRALGDLIGPAEITPLAQVTEEQKVAMAKALYAAEVGGVWPPDNRGLEAYYLRVAWIAWGVALAHAAPPPPDTSPQQRI